MLLAGSSQSEKIHVFIGHYLRSASANNVDRTTDEKGRVEKKKKARQKYY
jgi:hypothetical protein